MVEHHFGGHHIDIFQHMAFLLHIDRWQLTGNFAFAQILQRIIHIGGFIAYVANGDNILLLHLRHFQAIDGILPLTASLHTCAVGNASTDNGTVAIHQYYSSP